MAQDLDQLIAARLVQAVGGGVLVPVGTAAAAHLFERRARPRALGVIGALTFLGMAAGPFLGAAILSTVHPEEALAAAGLRDSAHRRHRRRPPGAGSSTSTCRSASSRWSWPGPPSPAGRRPAAPGRLDILGAALFGRRPRGRAARADARSGRAGASARHGLRPWRPVSAGLGALALVATLLDRRSRACAPPTRSSTSACSAVSPFSAAALVSLLTGYAFATAIIGGAVFVDRVLYGGPDEQRLALGRWPARPRSGRSCRASRSAFASYRVVTLVGLALSVVGLVAMAGLDAGDRHPRRVPLALALFGLGFGLTVTPRSTAAVEAAGRAAFGAASSVVTVARMLGHGDRPRGADRLRLDDDRSALGRDLRHARRATSPIIPESLRDRPLRDPLVVEALESWASREAASIMVGLFLVAAVVTVGGGPARLALGGARRRRVRSDGPRRRVCWPPDGDPDPGLIL